MLLTARVFRGNAAAVTWRDDLGRATGVIHRFLASEKDPVFRKCASFRDSRNGFAERGDHPAWGNGYR